MARIVLAMSGGVDSSVSAYLLKQAGHEVVGVFMRHGESSPAVCQSQGAGERAQLPVIAAAHKQGCCSASDAHDARRVADTLDIPFYALNLQDEFGRIIDYFVEEYTAARTPNPCVVCNHWVKFGKLFDYSDSIAADYVATGHYARLDQRPGQPGGPALCRGRDPRKDQSYVLFGVDRDHLSRMMLPIGDYEKTEIRQIAGRIGLRVAEKKDSQEICFVTSGKYDDFVRARRGERDTSGPIVTTDGSVVGHHGGIEGFTVGQRRGLGVALGEPRFVVRIEPATYRVVIGKREELARSTLTARGVSWLVDPPSGPLRCAAQVRYNSLAVPATAELTGDGELRVAFDKPIDNAAPGQAVVCYDGERVLGGGWID